jgi:hypothetical protein
MAVITAFSDETEVHSAEGKFLMGGYIAPADDWPLVESAWQDRVLDGPPKLPYLHMRKIRNSKWQQKYGITDYQAGCRVTEAAQVMHSFGNLAVIASSVRRSYLGEVFHAGRYKNNHYIPRGIDQPDYLAFVGYALFTVGQVHKKWPHARKVDFVVERKKGVTEHVREFKDELQKLLDPPLAGLVGELIPASAKDSLPLQAADVLLWHIQRYYAVDEDQNKMQVLDQERLGLLTGATSMVRFMNGKRPI